MPICGYTQEELEKYFEPYFSDLKVRIPKEYDLLESIKYWYNGYRFSIKDLTVYNPFCTLLLFKELEFKSYWFASATPTFLIDLIKQKDKFDINSLLDDAVSVGAFDAYEIDDLEVLPLLVQTGYLIIKDVKKYGMSYKYKLGFPNREVRYAFNDSLLKSLSDKLKLFSTCASKIADALFEEDYEKLFEVLKA